MNKAVKTKRPNNFTLDILEKPNTSMRFVDTTKTDTPNVDALLVRAKQILSERNLRISDLAKFVGVNWNQCHEWLEGKHRPSGEYVLLILEWIGTHDTLSGHKVSMKRDKQGNPCLYNKERKLSPFECDLWFEANAAKQLLTGKLS